MFLILISGIIFILLGRWIFGKWFNHVSLYAGIWSGSLALFELRLINYYPLESETWIIILTGWLAFLLGSVTVVIAKLALGKSDINSLSQLAVTTNLIEREQHLLEKILWVLNIITLFAALHSWYLLINKFGSISGVFVYGSLLYSFRVSEGLPGSIPYISSLSLTATLLAGVYTTLVGRVKLIAILPIFIVVIIDLSSMGRALMVMAAILFCTGYFLMPHPKRMLQIKTSVSKYKRFVSVLVAIALLIGGGELVRSTRHVNEDFQAANRTLQQLQGASFITPSIYLYLTVHHGVLNQYLKQNSEHAPVGSNTFASVFRILEKFGFNTHVNTYQIPYNTPIGANTGTYLRELHADFGLIGILVIPYLIGLSMSFLWYRLREKKKYVDLALMGYLQVVVGMSLFYIATRAGYLLVYLIGSLVMGMILDRLSSNNKSLNSW